MKRNLPLAALALLILSASASAHFVFIVPADDGGHVTVFFSEQLDPDPDVPIDEIAGRTVLVAISAAGRASPLECTRRGNALESAPLPAATAAVGGVTRYGVVQAAHTANKPALLVYYPKAIVRAGSKTGERILSDRAPLEIVPGERDGRPALRVFYNGQPAAGVACAVLQPGQHEAARGTADADGFVPGPFDKPGRVAVWARFIEKKSGELDGRKYDEVRHYATLTLAIEK